MPQQLAHEQLAITSLASACCCTTSAPLFAFIFYDNLQVIGLDNAVGIAGICSFRHAFTRTATIQSRLCRFAAA